MSSQSCTRHPREPVPLPWARPSRPVLCGDCTQACLMQLGRSITDTCQIRPEPRWLELVTPTHDGDPRRGAVSRLALGHALPTGGPFSSCCRNQATFRASSNAIPEPSAGMPWVWDGLWTQGVAKKQNKHTRMQLSLLDRGESFKDLSQRRSNVVEHSTAVLHSAAEQMGNSVCRKKEKEKRAPRAGRFLKVGPITSCRVTTDPAPPSLPSLLTPTPNIPSLQH